MWNITANAHSDTPSKVASRKTLKAAKSFIESAMGREIKRCTKRGPGYYEVDAYVIEKV